MTRHTVKATILIVALTELFLKLLSIVYVNLQPIKILKGQTHASNRIRISFLLCFMAENKSNKQYFENLCLLFG